MLTASLSFITFYYFETICNCIWKCSCASAEVKCDSERKVGLEGKVRVGDSAIVRRYWKVMSGSET